MSDFAWILNYPAKLVNKPEVNTIQFGEGYSQRTSDGLNTTPEKWQLSADKISLVDASAIHTFLKTRAGVTAFTWTNGFNVEIKVICQTWDITFNNDDENVFSATFDEVFDA